jgi:hypothetical protein
VAKNLRSVPGFGSFVERKKAAENWQQYRQFRTIFHSAFFPWLILGTTEITTFSPKRKNEITNFGQCSGSPNRQNPGKPWKFKGSECCGRAVTPWSSHCQVSVLMLKTR